mgnify:CR=1 FL=1
MKIGKSTLLLFASVIFAASGIIGCFFMEKDDLNLSKETVESKAGPEEVYVHVKGEVKRPGLYILESGNRVNDAVEAAGGATDNADLNRLNLADLISDQIEIYVPKTGGSDNAENNLSENTASNNSNDSNNLKINLNTASEEELIKVNGIGPVTAAKIIKYRNGHGGKFKNLEELMNISGIGKKKFQKLKNCFYIE